HGELVDKLAERTIGVEVFLEPAQREFHHDGRARARADRFPPPQGGRERGCITVHDASLRRLPTQSSGKRRKVERAKTVMRQPAHVRLEEGAQVRHAVFEHGDTVDPHAPGKALKFVGIEPAIAQHVRMHHAAAENLHPIVAFAEADLTLLASALDIHLQRWLGERKERRTKTHLDLIDLEERLAEFLGYPFQMTEMRALVD